MDIWKALPLHMISLALKFTVNVEIQNTKDEQNLRSNSSQQKNKSCWFSSHPENDLPASSEEKTIHDGTSWRCFYGHVRRTWKVLQKSLLADVDCRTKVLTVTAAGMFRSRGRHAASANHNPCSLHPLRLLPINLMINVNWRISVQWVDMLHSWIYPLLHYIIGFKLFCF